MDLRGVIRVIENPAQLLVAGFIALIGLGTVLLWLPPAAGDVDPTFGDALFMSTSAATITGMTTLDVADFSLYGQLVILVLIQVGGLGVMSIGTLLGLLAMGRIGLRQRMLARAEIGSVGIGEVRSLMVAIVKITVVVEGVGAIVLAVWFWAAVDMPVATAVYQGVFDSVASFNNAGMTPDRAGLAPYVADPVVVGVVTVSIILGGLGFPVVIELWRRIRPRAWTLHTKMVLGATAALLVVGPAVMIMFEWTNPDTLGPLDIDAKLLAAWFQGVTPRTAGFSTVDIGALNEPTLLVMTGLMFIGAGPASTGGGIRITTFALLAAVLWSTVRGDADVQIFRRRLPAAVIRQATSVVLLAIAVVLASTLLLLAVTDFTLTQTLFESTSAFGTVGLSTGITPELPGVGRAVLMVMMLTGRVGPVTLVTALALRERPRLYRYPEDRPILG